MSKEELEEAQAKLDLKKTEESKEAELKIAKDAEIFDKKYKSVFETLEYILSGKEQKLINGILDDYSKEKPGITVGSIFRMIGFALRNPSKIGDLITLARNSNEIINNTKFQQKLLNSEQTLVFVQNIGEKLPQVGKVLSNFGVKEFNEGAILDEKGLTALQRLFVEPKSLFRLRDIAIAFKDPNSDQKTNINKIFDLMKTSKGFENYIQTKGSALKEYMVNGAKSYIENDILLNQLPRTKERANDLSSELLEDKMNKYGVKVENLDKLLNIVPILLKNPEALQKFYNNFNKGDYTGIIKDILKMPETPEIQEYLQDNRDLFVGVINASLSATPGMKGYDIKAELYDLVPQLLNHKDVMIKIIEHHENGNYQAAVQDVLNLIGTDKEIQKYFKENGKNLQNLIASSVTQYIESDTLLNQLPRTKERSEEAPTELLANKLEKYGIKTEDIGRITEIVPILLDKPEELKKFYDNFNKGDYVGLAKDMLELSKNNTEIAKYWEKNKDIFQNVMVKTVENIPELQKFQLKGEMLDLFGPLLTEKNVPQIQEMVGKYEKGNWTGIVIDFCKLIENDPELKKQLENNKGNLGKMAQAIVDNAPFVKGYIGQMQVDELVVNMLKDPKGLREGAEAFEKGGTQMVWGLAKLGVNKVLDPEFRGAVIKGVGTYLFGDGKPKEKIVEKQSEKETEIFNSQEALAIRALANHVGKNLFGDSFETTRKNETQMIETGLKEIFADLKGDNKNVDIENVIKNHYEKLVGKVDAGYLSTSRTGLTELFYKNSTGNLWIELKEEKILGTQFKKELKEHVKKEVGEDILKLPHKEYKSITKELGQSVKIDSKRKSEDKNYQTTTPIVKNPEKTNDGRSL